jgi:hypothetical protein
MTHITTGRVLTAITALFLTFDAAVKVLRLDIAVEGTMQLGYPDSIILPLGLVQLAFLALYLIPRTAVFGAVLWTGYLGGAVATHVRLGNPLFTHTLSPIYVAAFLWLGLWLRDRRVRTLLSAPSI